MKLVITTRKAEIYDIPGIYQVYTNGANVTIYNEPIEYSKIDFIDYIDDNRSILLVCDDGREIIGFLLAFDMLSWCYVDILIVDRQNQRKGVASRLIDYLLRIGNKNWETIEMCYYVDQNIEVFFEKAGFVFNKASTKWVSLMNDR